jgi:uncharacterized protein (TIGR00369 family)
MTASQSAPHRRELRLTIGELKAFLDGAFPQAARASFGEVLGMELDHVQMRLDPSPDTLRPGDIVSGPTLMGLADVAAYAVVIAHIGAVPMAVTSNLNIAFLRPCHRAAVTADARLLKLGRRSATVDVRLWQVSEDRLVAQATVSYALPDQL